MRHPDRNSSLIEREAALNLGLFIDQVEHTVKLHSFALAIIICTASPLAAQSVPLEPGAMISDTQDFPRSKLLSLIDPGVGMIRAYGWHCDSISAVRPFIFSRGFTIVCNNFNYTYDISDKGGNWVVELK